jgi:molybdopterin biosynthesis enzyme
MKPIPVHQAVGAILGHDVTRIVPGAFKGRAFKRGHVITEADIPELLKIGKEHIYAIEMTGGMVHEDDAARRIAGAAAGPGIRLTDVSEGKVNLEADRDGLLKVNVPALSLVNAVPDVIFGALHTNHRVSKGRALAGTRVIPLAVPEEIVARAETILAGHYPLIQVKPFQPWRIGVVTTGSEVYSGRIEDAFGPVVRKKFDELGSVVHRQILVSDQVDMTVAAIHQLVSEGCQMIVVTGGMSVDPDDQTPAAIRASGARVVSYGAPAFPGAMFLLAYLDDVPVVGLPGCVMYYKATIFDLVVPRLLAGENVTRVEILALCHGGFCAGCAECRYPLCGFGKG